MITLMISDVEIKNVIQSLKRIPIDSFGNDTILDYDLGFSNEDKEILLDRLRDDLGVDVNHDDVCRINTIGMVIKLVNKRV